MQSQILTFSDRQWFQKVFRLLYFFWLFRKIWLASFAHQYTLIYSWWLCDQFLIYKTFQYELVTLNSCQVHHGCFIYHWDVSRTWLISMYSKLNWHTALYIFIVHVQVLQFAFLVGTFFLSLPGDILNSLEYPLTSPRELHRTCCFQLRFMCWWKG